MSFAQFSESSVRKEPGPSKKPMSFTINHTSVTSHNTVCTKEKDYGGSHTEEEHDHEDDRQNFYKFDKDNVHLDEEYQLNEQKIRASRESHRRISPRRHTSKSGRKMWFFWPETFSTASLPLRNLISQVPRKSSQDLQQGHKKALADHKKDFF